jgi:FkbM family methyltransferase
MISYAQNFEDVILHRCFAGRKDGFYIDVGAMDPVLHSVTKFFYDEGWSGINIEPNDFFYNKLLQERPRDINLNLALGEREEIRPWHVFEQYGISTFEEGYRDRFIEQGFEVEEKTAKVTTLAAICQEYVKREIDFLKIDCEGWEKFVIQGADWDRFRPAVVIVEATEPLSTTPSWSEWEPLLTENGRYQMVYFDGLNRFYLRRESTGLRRHFELPPNVFDEFTVHATEARQQNDVLRHELNTAEQDRKSLLQHSESLAARIAELEESLKAASAQAVRDQAQIAELVKERGMLEERLLATRLWVGQLSQELAASRQRP